MEVSDARIREILEASGCEVDADWSVTLPPHRPDLCITEDLYEEVGRIHGYEHVRAELPTARLASPPRNPLFWRADQVRESLVAHGLDEVYLGPWFGDAEVERFGLERSVLVELKNPLVETLRYFRSTPLPGIVATAQENAKLFGHFGFFEIGTLYRRESSGIAETPRLAGAVVGPGEDLDGVRVLQVRDTLVAMLDHLGIPSVIRRSETTGDVVDVAQLHPGRWGSLDSEDGVHLGVFGELHPRLARAVGLKVSPVIFSVDLGEVYERAGDGVRFRPPPRFPSVESHVNVLAPGRMMSSELLARVDSPDLVRRTVRDVWTGEGVPAGRRRLTLELEFNRPDRSLTHEEVMERLVALKAALESSSDLTVEIPA
jgi:phenylalanyl-tRNA synthetase beta chain